MRRIEKTCICCGEKYEFCFNCSDYDNLPRWMNIYHNENCKDLFNITSDYLAGNITAEQAKEKYEKCDLSYKYKLHESIKKAINEVNKLSKKSFEKKEKDFVKVAEKKNLNGDL